MIGSCWNDAFESVSSHTLGGMGYLRRGKWTRDEIFVSGRGEFENLQITACIQRF